MVLASVLLVAGCTPKEDPPACLTCVVSEEPEQSSPESDAVMQGKDYTLTPRAEYSVTAAVRGVKSYAGTRGPMEDIVPMDMALAWGYAARPEVVEKISVTQRHRMYIWRTQDPGVGERGKEAAWSMANTHLIPATEEMARQLRSVSEGDVVWLSGTLVDVRRGKKTLKTSLTRKDTELSPCGKVRYSLPESIAEAICPARPDALHRAAAARLSKHRT